MSQMYEKVIGLIERDPPERSKHDIEFILPWLQKKSKLLQDMQKDVVSDIIRNCNHEKCSTDELVIKQGTHGESFYIILNGKVSVYIDGNLTGEDPTKLAEPPKEKKSKKRLGTGNTGEGTNEDADVSNEEEAETEESDEEDGIPEDDSAKPLDRDTLGKFIVHFDSGKSFGEIALISENNIRNASVVTDEETDFLVIHRDLYNRCLKEFAEQEFEEKRTFVDTHPYFSNWALKFKKLLEMSIRKETFDYDRPIVEQGQPFDGLVFVLSGNVKVVSNPGMHNKQYPENAPFVLPTVYQESWMPARKKAHLDEQSASRSLKQQIIYTRRKEGYAAAEKKVRKKYVELCYVKGQEIIGDIEAACGLPTYGQSVKSMAETKTFVLDLKNFERLVLRRNPDTLEVIKECVVNKLDSRAFTHKGVQIPLLAYIHFQLSQKPANEIKKLDLLRNCKELPENDILLKHLLTWFVDNKCPLIKPYVPGAVYYKDLMQEKAKSRYKIKQTRRKSSVILPSQLRKEMRSIERKPRSITALKEALSKMKTMEDDNKNAYEFMPTDSVLAVVAEAQNEAANSRRRPSMFDKRPSLFDGDFSKRRPSVVTFSDEQSNAIVAPYAQTWKKRTSGMVTILSPIPREADSGETDQLQSSGDSQFNEEMSTNMTLEPIIEAPTIEVTSDCCENVELTPEQTVFLTEHLAENQRELLLLRQKTMSPVSEPDMNVRAEQRPLAKSDNFPSNELPSISGAKNALSESMPNLSAKKQRGRLENKVVLPPLSADEVNRLQEAAKNTGKLQFVSSYVRNKFKLVEQEQEFRDMATSDQSLSFLEDRIKNFSIRNPRRSSTVKKSTRTVQVQNLPKLKRYQVMDTLNQPKPGGMVLIKKQLCALQQTDYHVKDHKHVHYHMVSAIPDKERLLRTKAVVEILTGHVVNSGGQGSTSGTASKKVQWPS